MIAIDQIVLGGVYAGKTGLPRKVVQFCHFKPSGSAIKVSSPVGADIQYVRVKPDGTDYAGGTCWCSTFAQWATERIDT